MKDAGHATMEAIRTLSPKRSRSSQDALTPSSSRPRRRRTRTPRAASSKKTPSAATDNDFVQEWGITKDQEATLLKEFRQLLEKDLGGPLKPIFDNIFLTRFLRARQHDLKRACAMFKAHLKWREEYGTDTILEDFTFNEREAFLTLYPQGYHKTDKLGRPIYIQHLGQINVKALMEITTEERMIRFHVQEYERALKYIFPACSLTAGHQVNGTLAIMDVKGVGLRHLSGEVKRILSAITRIDQDNYPETLGKTLIINAPVLFRGVWAVVKPMLDVRTQEKIEMCPGDYMKVLTKWVDMENIPSYLGGKSKGSLLDDLGPWHDPQIIAEIDKRWEERVNGTSTVDDEPYSDHEVPSPKTSSFTLDARRSSSGGIGSELAVGGSPSHATTKSAVNQHHHPSAVLPLPNGDDGSIYGDSDFDDAKSTMSSMRRGSSLYAESMRPSALVVDNPAGESPRTSSSMQISILGRIRTLEDKIPEIEKSLKNQLQQLPSKSIGQGTLVTRVSTLEKAVDVLLQAQIESIEERKGGGKSPHANAASRSCCTVM